jgi:hypothetical protein
MNFFTAIGRVADLREGKSKGGKTYYSFMIYIPSLQNDGSEVEVKKFCTMWSFDKDTRPSNLVNGVYVCIHASLVGYMNKKDPSKTFIAEKLLISDVMQVSRSVSKRDEIEDDSDDDLPF